MYLCSDGHDEICHEGRTCPACELKDQLKDADNTIESLESKNKDLNSEIDDLKREIRNLEEKNP